MNIIVVNSDGFPTSLDTKKILDDDGYQRQQDNIINSIRGAKRVMIFVHGGLTCPKEAIQRFKRLTSELQEEEILPVFIVWNSKLFSSYLESLLWIRRGSAYKKGFHKWLIQLLTPFAFLEDLARGLTRFIQTSLIAMGRDAQTNDQVFAKRPNWFPLKKRYRLSLARFFPENETYAWMMFEWITFVESEHSYTKGKMTIRVGTDKGFGKRCSRLVQYWFFWVPNIISYTILDAIGKRAWDNMLRRTRTITNNNPDVHVPEYLPPVQRFFKALSKTADLKRVDIIGHSMGTIIINEAIRQNPELRFNNIVYMGAACSIRNFCESVGKYLDGHKETEFFNICLHPRAEVSEYNALSLVRGSLLAWIDNFFADILTYEDRTMGSFENCVSCYEVIRTDRAVTLKCFSIDDSSAPQKHGDFNKYRFWDESYWK